MLQRPSTINWIVRGRALKPHAIIGVHRPTSVTPLCVPIHHFDMKTECIIRSAYFRATRRYAQWITKKEGVIKNELDIKGLEFMKANFPPIFGKFFNKILKSALTGTQQGEIDKWLLDFRKYIMSKECDIAILGNPTRVNTLEVCLFQL